nr:MAG TPA: hypothetical protein [Caudoviricetes sp.]
MSPILYPIINLSFLMTFIHILIRTDNSTNKQYFSSSICLTNPFIFF